MSPFHFDNFADEAARCHSHVSGHVTIVRPSHELRPDVEACIGEIYQHAFAARCLVFPRRLVALVDRSGHPVCAAGMRTHREGFFSDVYLDLPIEKILAALSGRPVARSEVVEVSTLASRTSDVLPFFIRQLVLLGRRAGFGWSFFTATKRLRKLLCQLRIPIVELQAADPARIADPGRWGSYYAHAPVVCAVNRDWLDNRAITPEKAAIHA